MTTRTPNIQRKAAAAEHPHSLPNSISIDRSKAVSLLQLFYVYASVVSCVAFVLSVFVTITRLQV